MKIGNCSMDDDCAENVVNMMTNEFPQAQLNAKKRYSQCVFRKRRIRLQYVPIIWRMLKMKISIISRFLIDFWYFVIKKISACVIKIRIQFCIKNTYEDACRLLNWERNEVPLILVVISMIKTKIFPVFIFNHEGE